MRTHTKETQATTTPQSALEFLREGNYRFVNNLKSNRNLLQQVNETIAGQFPFAAILSCIDSRTSAELIFDQGLGEIFSIRIAETVATISSSLTATQIGPSSKRPTISSLGGVTIANASFV